jgi:hypothetical protein
MMLGRNSHWEFIDPSRATASASKSLAPIPIGKLIRDATGLAVTSRQPAERFAPDPDN